MNCVRCGVPLRKNDKDETKDHCGFCARKLKLTKHEKRCCKVFVGFESCKKSSGDL